MLGKCLAVFLSGTSKLTIELMLEKCDLNMAFKKSTAKHEAMDKLKYAQYT